MLRGLSVARTSLVIVALVAGTCVAATGSRTDSAAGPVRRTVGEAEAAGRPAVTLGAMRAANLPRLRGRLPARPAAENPPGGERGAGSPSTTGGRPAVSTVVVAAVADNGMPRPAARAYRRAERVVARTDPSCSLDWTLLAGIGAVESSHGQYGGASVGRDGRSTPLIYGLPLNGAPGIASIEDSDGGRLDGDPVWDRAVGPMQFIPTTWAVMGADGDGDGRRDPHDLDDAALAAAALLCTGATDVSTSAGARTAVYRYNHSYDYVDLVLSYAAAYARGDYPTFAAARQAVHDGSSTGSGSGGTPGGGSGQTALASGAPGPEPDPQPSPQPAPQPSPAPAPQPSPAPAPDPQPVPEPTPDPQPSPQPVPDPTPGPDPTPPPDPAPTEPPEPEPTEPPEPEPTEAPEPEPTEPEPTVDPEPTAEPAPTVEPEPVPGTVPVPGTAGEQVDVTGPVARCDPEDDDEGDNSDDNSDDNSHDGNNDEGDDDARVPAPVNEWCVGDRLVGDLAGWLRDKGAGAEVGDLDGDCTVEPVTTELAGLAEAKAWLRVRVDRIDTDDGLLRLVVLAVEVLDPQPCPDPARAE